MKSIIGTKKVKSKLPLETETVKKEVEHVTKRKGLHPLGFAAILIATSVISAGATTYLVSTKITKVYEEKLKVLGTQTESTPKPELNDASQNVEIKKDTGVGGQYVVIVGDTPTGFLRVRKTPSGIEIAQVHTNDKLIYLDENAKWFKVELESGEQGWVSKDYSTKE